MAFSWEKLKERAIEKKISRAITMAKVGTNNDFRILHPDWIREAQNKQFSNLKKQVRDAVEKQQAVYMARRVKLGGK